MKFQNLQRFKTERPTVIDRLPIYTKEELIKFEDDICEIFNQGKIRAPVHLHNGNEEQIIKVFESVNPQDWVFSTWRSHYHCLLKGVPQETLKKEIFDGKSITLCFPEYKIFSSAIVTGVIPIALGAAMNAYRMKSNEHVWCFVGDMTSETGAFFEAAKYAVAWNLPISFVVEDNGKSVCTQTNEVWNSQENFWHEFSSLEPKNPSKVYHYKYESKYPHAGGGKRIQF
jgi:TPP-dependent pyruvate/acetoin dehydrogenase alpha subunit